MQKLILLLSKKYKKIYILNFIFNYLKIQENRDEKN